MSLTWLSRKSLICSCGHKWWICHLCFAWDFNIHHSNWGYPMPLLLIPLFCYCHCKYSLISPSFCSPKQIHVWNKVTRARLTLFYYLLFCQAQSLPLVPDKITIMGLTTLLSGPDWFSLSTSIHLSLGSSGRKQKMWRSLWGQDNLIWCPEATKILKTSIQQWTS